jgi:hypothetical protein
MWAKAKTTVVQQGGIALYCLCMHGGARIMHHYAYPRFACETVNTKNAIPNISVNYDKNEGETVRKPETPLQYLF